MQSRRSGWSRSDGNRSSVRGTITDIGTPGVATRWSARRGTAVLPVPAERTHPEGVHAVEVTLKGAEVECVKKLAQCYEAGNARWRGSEGWEELGLTEANYIQVLGQMEMIGAISDVCH